MQQFNTVFTFLITKNRFIAQQKKLKQKFMYAIPVNLGGFVC